MKTRTSLPEGRSVALATEVASPSLRMLESYWRSKFQDGSIPRREDVDPAEIVRHLPNIFIVDVIGNGEDFRYRLIGTNIVVNNERDLTGRYFSDFYRDDPEGLTLVRLGCDTALKTREATYTSGQAFWLSEWGFKQFECVYLPLRFEDHSVGMILGEIAYLDFAGPD
ncbi:MAG TPA: PAS domain-containing protein [Dongiaceae bacterium]